MSTPLAMFGGAGNDSLTGGSGNDTLDGGLGNDTMAGGTGNDTYLFEAAGKTAETDILIENAGEGTDTLDFSALKSTDPVTVNLNSDTLLAKHKNRTVKTGAPGQAANFENVVGGAGNDTIIGNAANNSLVGGAGNDTLTGGLGNDTIDGGTGTNMLVESGDVNFTLTNTSLTGLGTDTLLNIQQARLTGGASNNTLDASGFIGAVTLDGGAGNDSLVGGSGSNVLLGGAGNDTLTGGSGRNLLIGGSGTDSLTGGSNDDILVGGLVSYYNETTNVVDFKSLSAIMAEWTSADSYTTRISKLMNGGGANGTTVLNSTVVSNDNAVDTLTGGLGLDWFIISSGDIVTDQNTGGTETVTTV